LKMASICDSEHLRDCIPYESIKYEKKDGSEASVSVSDLKTAKKLNLEGGFEDVAAFVLADGTPVLISYDKTCEVDTEELDKTISSCVAGLYDINGSRKPNKFLNKTETVNGKTISYSADLKTFNGAGIDSSTCLGKVGSLCITKSVAFPKDVWQDYFDEMPKCRHSSGQQYNNYFLIAQKYCEGKGKLPSASDLAKIATALYGETIGDEETIYRDSTVRAISISSENKNAVYSALGIEANPTNSGFGLWSDRETPDHDGAYLRAFYNDYTIYIGNVCGAEFMRAVCLEE
ncbi:hypothetical protein IJ579_06585, partial [bacterium]|nr:hypothetical protein [bacterium]